MRDEFYWLGQINKACIISNCVEGLLNKDLAKKAARALQTVLDNATTDSERVKRVIDFEPKMIEAAASADITAIHVGRSSQDMHGTYRVAILRDNVLKVTQELENLMRQLLNLANCNQDTLIPSYTNGVAAQPTSFAHYLLGYLDGLRRDRVRLSEFFIRLNHCPMGSCVLNGSGWPLNRKTIAKYLGFTSPIRNAFDATQIAVIDLSVEFSQIQSSIALHISSIIADIMTQYAEPIPWFTLIEGKETTYVSSAMPQKRNPGLLNQCRSFASDVLGLAVNAQIRAHNLSSGMPDAKSVKTIENLADTTIEMLRSFTRIVNALDVNKERALEELNSDWTASQEIADQLMKKHSLPFRVGHHVASAVVNFARAHHLTPLNFEYEEFKKIYSGIVQKEMPTFDSNCPMSEEEFKNCLDPHKILSSRQTAGSANPTEVKRLLESISSELDILKEQTQMRIASVNQAMADLDERFNEYLLLNSEESHS